MTADTRRSQSGGFRATCRSCQAFRRLCRSIPRHQPWLLSCKSIYAVIPFAPNNDLAANGNNPLNYGMGTATALPVSAL